MIEGGRLSRSCVALFGSALLLLACSDPSPVVSDYPSADLGEFLTDVRDEWILSETEAIKWHEVKDEKGPAFTGNPSWHQFVAYVEEKLGEYGVVDIRRNQWSFKRWHSSEWPDRSNWSLVSGGEELEVANYGANSGSTGPDGVTAELVYYDKTNPPDDIAGKIVVFSTIVDQALVNRFSNSDFEYRSGFESFPEYGRLIPDDLTDFQSSGIFLQLLQIPPFIRPRVAQSAFFLSSMPAAI